MTYSRKYLSQLEASDLPNQNTLTEVLSTLMAKLYANEAMTLAEKTFICRKLPLIHTDESIANPLDPYDFSTCEEVLFRIRYIIYFNNVNGWYKAYDWRGEIPAHHKERDLEMINRHHVSWYEVIRKTDHEDEILQHISKETRHHIKQIERYCRSQFMGGNRRDYLIKAIILHSKYMYYIVLEYYEENKPVESLKVNSKYIKIDTFSFIHILFRHYAQIIKEYQVGKSYHNENIDYKNLPQELLKIIKYYMSIEHNNFDEQKIYFSTEDGLYAIWFRNIKKDTEGGKTIEQLRVQTFYPVKDPVEIERVSINLPLSQELEGYTFHIAG